MAKKEADSFDCMWALAGVFPKRYKKRRKPQWTSPSFPPLPPPQITAKRPVLAKNNISWRILSSNHSFSKFRQNTQQLKIRLHMIHMHTRTPLPNTNKWNAMQSIQKAFKSPVPRESLHLPPKILLCYTATCVMATTPSSAISPQWWLSRGWGCLVF